MALVLLGSDCPHASFITIKQRPLVVRYFQLIGFGHFVRGLSRRYRQHPGPIMTPDERFEQNAVSFKKRPFDQHVPFRGEASSSKRDTVRLIKRPNAFDL
jgi:hypothetical protein